MISGGTVTFPYEYENPDNDNEVVELDVEAKIATYHPVILPDLHSPGHPAEGGGVEELTVCWPDGTEMDPIPSALVAELTTRAIEEHMDNG